MNKLTFLDSIFLGVESQALPAHVAGLQVFELPKGKGSAWLHSLMEELRQRVPGSPFNEKLKMRVGGLPELVVDEEFDVDYHVRHSVLPKPGNDEQLHNLLTRIHANLLDRDRPLWELHLIEGLAKRRFLPGNARIALLLSSPNTALSKPLGAARSVAFTSFPLAELKAMGRPVGATLNDVVLALCDAALLRYLSEQGQYPARPLVASVPVNLRAANSEDEGNLVTGIQVKLGEKDQDHLSRLRTISDSMRIAKEMYSGLGADSLAAVGSGLHLEGIMPPPFNVIISNVPGPRETRYFGGARMLATYPLSGITPMNTLNVTVYSYDGELYFGLIAGRRALPHLHDLKLCIDEIYEEFRRELL